MLGTDRGLGREQARAFVNDYLALPNYVRNLRRLGFTDDDLHGRASDRLVDALVAYGDEETIAAGSARITTREPTTCASTSSEAGMRRSRSTPGAAWHRP